MSSAGSISICPRYHHAVELIGRRWTGAIIRGLLQGPARYNQLRLAIPDVSDRMLCERLRELETEGIITRTVVPESPVRVEYELTAKGKALEEAILAISSWAEKWARPQDVSEGERLRKRSTHVAKRHDSKPRSRPAVRPTKKRRARG